MQSSTLMAAMTKSAVEELAAGRHQTFGSDVTLQIWPIAGGADDQISLGASDWISASVSKGVLFEFSLVGGALKVDQDKNTKVYGAGVTVADILGGTVAKPQEMVPLYQKIAEVASKALC